MDARTTHLPKKSRPRGGGTFLMHFVCCVHQGKSLFSESSTSAAQAVRHTGNGPKCCEELHIATPIEMGSKRRNGSEGLVGTGPLSQESTIGDVSCPPSVLRRPRVEVHEIVATYKGTESERAAHNQLEDKDARCSTQPLADHTERGNRTQSCHVEGERCAQPQRHLSQSKP